MKVYRSQFIVLVILFVSAFAAKAQVPKAHRHLGNMPSMLKEIERAVSLVEAAPDKDAQIEGRVKNKNRTFEAFIADKTQIFVRDLKTGKTYEIKGLPLENRYFSDLVWTNNQTLMFDRWAQPHYGTHYAFNVARKKLTAAVPFPDEFMFKQKSSKNKIRKTKR